MRDAWQDLLRRLSGPHVSFSFGDVARWKKIDFQTLCDLYLLSDAKPATHLLCPECSGHWAEVTWTEEGMRAFIVCTREGRPVDVDPEHLRQWAPNKERFVALLAGLGITDRALSLMAEQVWRLGRCTVAHRQRDVFFAAIASDDLSSALTEIRSGYGSVAGVLLLPSCAPDPGHNSKLRIVDLSSVAVLRHDRIVVNLPFIEEQFDDDRGLGTSVKQASKSLRDHRRAILRTYMERKEIQNVDALGTHLHMDRSVLSGIVRSDKNKYGDSRLKAMLKKIGCSRANWDRVPKLGKHA